MKKTITTTMLITSLVFGGLLFVAPRSAQADHWREYHHEYRHEHGSWFPGAIFSIVFGGNQGCYYPQPCYDPCAPRYVVVPAYQPVYPQYYYRAPVVVYGNACEY